eukprot:CAMPEP_0184732782 /NCGR_PEP_ID=MMETSP0314-20130426/55461_1 /TAXON_ID=38298 /ORGANISM="Rhodella maculata, Strain CCMP 736" /LENGTH=119 /DNA_ID=CAMNT_0027199447 /DNA_START=132 /DNA_END=487 /DNA_ORIENTATION=-
MRARARRTQRLQRPRGLRDGPPQRRGPRRALQPEHRRVQRRGDLLAALRPQQVRHRPRARVVVRQQREHVAQRVRVRAAARRVRAQLALPVLHGVGQRRPRADHFDELLAFQLEKDRLR